MPITTTKNYVVLAPGDNILAGAAVSGSGDADYPMSYLTDERPSFPIRFDAGAWSATATASGNVNLVVLANTSVDGNVTTGIGTIIPGALGDNGIRLNPFKLIDAPSAVTSVAVSGTNTAPMLLGELIAGTAVEIPSFRMSDFSVKFADYGGTPAGRWFNVPAHDDGVEGREVSGTQVFNAAQLAYMLKWKRGQNAFKSPGVLILDPTVNDAMVCVLSGFSYKQGGHKDLYEVSATFLEWPRYRW